MTRNKLLLGAFAAFAPIGCYSWRHPVPFAPGIHASAEPASPQNVAALPAQAMPDVPAANPAPAVVTAVAAKEVDAEVPSLPRESDPLRMVADSLERGDKLTAARHLEEYVRRYPEQVMFRLQLAELLLQADKDSRARVHFELFAAKAQTGPEGVRKYLVHVHTRLMEIAQRTDDPFSEQLHRGIGLLVLLQEQDMQVDRDDAFCEEMLCKALRAFNGAREIKPGDPRLRVYLAEICERMGNRRSAIQERAVARRTAMPGELAPGEQSCILLSGTECAAKLKTCDPSQVAR